MGEIDLVKRLRDIIDNINYFQHMNFSCPYQRMYYQDLILQEVAELQFHLGPIRPGKKTVSRQEIFTEEELAQYDGSEGKEAYVAVNGIVYDVSQEATWGGGTHFGLYAGKVLSQEFQSCHPGMEAILAQLPQVGILEEA